MPIVLPENVVADELIESAWGNAVVGALSWVHTGLSTVQVMGNAGFVALPAAQWTMSGVGTFTVDVSRQVLLIVGASVGCDTGEVFLNMGIQGGSQLFAPVSARAVCVNAETMWLTVAGLISLGPGSHILQAGMNVAGTGGNGRSTIGVVVLGKPN